VCGMIVEHAYRSSRPVPCSTRLTNRVLSCRRRSQRNAAGSAVNPRSSLDPATRRDPARPSPPAAQPPCTITLQPLDISCHPYLGSHPDPPGLKPSKNRTDRLLPNSYISSAPDTSRYRSFPLHCPWTILGSAIPNTPARLGVTEWAFVSVIVGFGIPVDVAAQ
jgi:hypothetical protein